VDRVSGTTRRRPLRPAVVRVPAGTCDLRDVPAIAELISEAVATGASHLVVDLSALDGADATLLTLLHRTHRRLAEDGCSLTVVAAGAMVQALQRYGLDDVLRMHATVEGALGGAPRMAPDSATISSACLPATLLVTLGGEWDIANADRLAQVLDEGIDQGLPLVVVDLSAVTFLDVRTMSCLRQAAHRLAAQGRRLALVAPPPAVERILDLVDGDSALPRSDTLVAARTGKDQVALTKRQREILGLLDEGLTSKQIARRLWISPATVRNHVHAVLAALHVHSRLQAVRRARELGLLAAVHYAPEPVATSAIGPATRR
jgi:anti-anti-sigma factor